MHILKKKITFHEMFHVLQSKKGEASWVLISMILLVISLAILVLIFMQLNSSVSAQREACHTSAVLRGTVPDVGGVNVKNSLALNCVTKKICVSTESKGKCTELFDKNFETITVSGTREEKEKQILQLLAREMADCWNMMGEGKLAVFSREVSGEGSTYTTAAVVCARIAFDDTITSNENYPSNIESVSGFNSYLLTHKVPGKQISYWDYFRDTPDGDTLAKLSGSDFIQAEKDIFYLKDESAIIYTEFKPSEIGKFIGQGVGAVGYLAAVIGTRGKALVSTGTAATVIPITVGLGGYLGDKAYLYFFSDTDGKESVPGLFLIKYTQEGFKELQGKSDFYIASKV